MLALLVPMAAGAQEPYAVLSEENTVLTFYYDDQKAARNGMDVWPFEWFEYYGVNSGWYKQRKIITRVIFDDSFAGCTTLTSTAYWFYELLNLSSITGISNLKTDNVTDMSSMFYHCSGLTSLDVSGFNTENVTDMSYMFDGCYGLKSLDVSGFRTENVTDMSWMFAYCWGLTSLDVSGFNTENVMDMSLMFSGCYGLKSLDVSGFNTEKVTSMDCMFQLCSGLTSLDVTGFKTDKVTKMSFMFSICSGLTSLDLLGFKTDKVTDMRWMFQDCRCLTTIYAGDGWSTEKVWRSGSMFAGCTSLVGGAGTLYNESHTDKIYARIDGGSDNPGYFTWKEASGEKPEGDLSGDGKLDADDIVTLVNVIMGGNKSKLAAADLNHDGKVDVADLTMLVNMILDGK